MSTVSKDKGPVLLDPFGNEVCWLFLKHGKCRYKKKCKKSHILPDKGNRTHRSLLTKRMKLEQPIDAYFS